MAFSQERTELEQRFELLFEQTFQCRWQDYLTAQYHVHVDGQNFYIDYVYIGQGRKIALEVDGHGKIKGATDSTQKFHDLLARQNDLMGQGFEVYRFGWNHVVSMGGWRAKRDLKRIFRGLIQPTPKQKGQKQTHPVLNAIPTLWKPRKSGDVIAYTAPQRYQSHHDRSSQSTGVHAEVIEAQVFPYQSAPQKTGILRGFVLGVFVLGITVLLLDKIRPAQQPQEETKSTTPLSEVIPVKETALPTKQEPVKPTHPAQHTQQVVTRTVYVPQPTKPQVIRIETPAIQAPAVAPSTLAQPVESKPTPIQATESATPSAEPDEIVAFNQKSGVYHNPSSEWAKRCTRNCIYIPKSQAIQRGGRASRSSGPNDF